jgi:GntR family transcriptional regulator
MMSPAAQALPLYMQITELLTREIAAGHWQSGERLPTEAELARRLGVAVGTLRKALAELQARGVLRRRQGSGTFVQLPAGGRSIYEFFRLERLQGAGLPSADVLALDCVAPPPLWHAAPGGTAQPPGNACVDTAAPAGAALPSACWRVRRLRRLDQQPVALEEIWFDARHRATLGVAELHESLYYFYRQQLGFWISQVEDHLGLGQVPDWVSTIGGRFGLPAGAPTVLIERRSWSQTGRLEEVSRTWLDPAQARYAARWR